ncbi:MAG: AGE family epimerase/isomerase [Calditrichia bacterium]
MELKIYHLLIILQFCFVIELPAQQNLTSPHLQHPEKVIGYADSCAKFWVQTYDTALGGFFTEVGRSGNILSYNHKNVMTQSRNAYGMVRAFMLTGDTAYFNLAKGALQFLYNHGWDGSYGGWFERLDRTGNPADPYAAKTAFYQHYALLGPMAFYEAAGDTLSWNWLQKGYAWLENHFWDNRSGLEGYYDESRFDGLSAKNKSFNATVDAVTTHLLYLYLTGIGPHGNDKSRLLEMASEMKNHLAASMAGQVIGFVENYDSNWNYDNSNTLTLMGHVLKTAWCLGRIYQIQPDSSYLMTADSLFKEVWNFGYDHEYGGPYKDFNRQTGQMMLWGNPDTTKAWWQMEQAVTAGLMLYAITNEPDYLHMADQTLQFFMKYFVDHQFGEVYADRTRYGGFAWSEEKGNAWKGAYHSIELAYYTYLYGNLFVHLQPVTLHYYFQKLPYNRDIRLTPLAIHSDQLKIRSVLFENQAYPYYNAVNRLLTLPAGTGGHFTVVYEPVATPITEGSQPGVLGESFRLFQNFPNPFNPATTISYQLNSPAEVTLTIYNMLGQEIKRLVQQQQPAGLYRVKWNGKSYDGKPAANGIYLYRLKADGTVQTKKMVLLR